MPASVAVETSTLDLARAYLAAGLGVLPIRPDGSKAPNLERGHPYLRRRPTERDLVRWFGDGRHGLAIPGGKVSGNLECLDFETTAVFRAWCELVEAVAPALIFQLCQCVTPGHLGERGLHVRYRCTAVDIPGNTVLAREADVDPVSGTPRVDRRGKPKSRVLVETRGEGGYAVAPGSPPACHETGRLWEHVAGPGLTELADISAEARAVLLQSARGLNRWLVEADRVEVKPKSGAGVFPGTDYNRRGPDWAELVTPHGWQLVRTLGEVRCWRRPGKDAGSCSATTGYCKDGEGNDMLYVFSSSAEPFEMGRAYTRWRAYALLEHAGDWKGAARALRELGYGERRTGPPPRVPSSNGHAHPPEEAAEPNLTDVGNAMRLVRANRGDLRYCYPFGKWLVWDAQRWAWDDTGQVTRRAKGTIAALLAEALGQLAEARARLRQEGEVDEAKEKEDPGLARAKNRVSWCLKSESAGRINAMVDMARSEPGVPIRVAELDRDPWLLATANGTVDLRSGRLRSPEKAHMITQLCPTCYHPEAQCPAWEGFLGAIFQEDAGLIGFMQRFLGYCLTGLVSEQILPIFWGNGANGKSTLVTTILEVMGSEYAMKAPAGMLLQRRTERHPTEQASLFGKRLVVSSEADEGARLNESLIKDLTGGERIQARRMREDFWGFAPSHKLVLLTNNKPKVRGTDTGIWRRLRLVPFEVTFWDPDDPASHGQSLPAALRQDKDLLAKLRGEYPGILTWLVRGCRLWQEGGLTLPEKVRVATAAYRADEDLIAQFLAECCVVGADFRCRASELRDSFVAWCEHTGEARGSAVPSQKRLGQALLDRNFTRYASNGTWYRGLALHPERPGEEPIPD